MGCSREKFPPRLCRRQFAGRLRGFRRELRQREASTAIAFAFGSIGPSVARIAIHPDWRELTREIANTGIMTCVLAAGRSAQREG
jgi:hypothetical protein